MFGGLKSVLQSLNTKLYIENQEVIKSPKSLGYSTRDSISLIPKISGLLEKGINLQLFGHKKRSATATSFINGMSPEEAARYKKY